MKKTIISLGVAFITILNVASASNTINAATSHKETAEFVIPGSSPLCTAISKGDIEAVRKFVEYGADVNEKTKNGLTPLMIAATYNKVEIINFLLLKGADPRLTNDSGYTAL